MKENKGIQLLIVILLGIVAVIVIAGYLLVAIWSGNYKETVKTETDTSYLENDLGKYRKVNITSEEQLSNYSNK
ncbi:MAG: hypothetical protein PHD20_01965, partial [Clostridia bacterium]|nr:hypothetical protein [Clostridia bacterium]